MKRISIIMLFACVASFSDATQFFATAYYGHFCQRLGPIFLIFSAFKQIGDDAGTESVKGCTTTKHIKRVAQSLQT